MPPKAPSPCQLSYLRALAIRAGQTFTPPKTASEASREITRLRAATATPADDRRRERNELADDLASAHGSSAAIQAHEITGHGSSARWS